MTTLNTEFSTLYSYLRLKFHKTNTYEVTLDGRSEKKNNLLNAHNDIAQSEMNAFQNTIY